MFKNIGWPEILVIVVVLVVLFGGKILPKIGRSVGESGKDFKDAANDLKDTLKKDK